jgi:hypothetical protein
MRREHDPPSERRIAGAGAVCHRCAEAKKRERAPASKGTPECNSPSC